MDFSDFTIEDRYEMMKKRQAYFAELASKSDSFKDFFERNDEWLAIVGVELFPGNDETPNDYIALRIQLDYTDYETYHIIKTPDGRLTASQVIWWQDNFCCNSLRNVITGNDNSEEEDIIKEYD